LITPRWTPADWRPLKEWISTRSWIAKNEIEMTVLISTDIEVAAAYGATVIEVENDQKRAAAKV
jgi:hypothetical protein